MTATHGRTEDDRDTPVVEYCANNVTRKSRAVVAKLPGDTRGLPCLERCGTCRTMPFLVVDGTVHKGESHARLCERIQGESP